MDNRNMLLSIHQKGLRKGVIIGDIPRQVPKVSAFSKLAIFYYWNILVKTVLDT